jgi:exopolyphosphatase/pppGpp-phosphohydrolase
MKRIGVIEIGSRGVRLLVAEVSENSLQVLLRRYDSDVKLAEAVESDAAQLSVVVSAVRQTIERYLQICREAGVTEVRIFGTEAVRKLRQKSRRHFLALSRNLPGFKVLRPRDEAYYSLEAAVRSLPNLVRDGDTVLVIDQGAGSMEVALGRIDRASVQMLAHKSYRLGTQVLVSRLHTLGGDFHRLTEWIALEIDDKPLRGSAAAKKTVILGSAVTKLAWLSLGPKRGERYSPQRVHGLTLTRKTIERFIAAGIVSGSLMRSIVDPENPASGEFEAVVAGLIAINLLLSRYKKDEFVVCAEALRYGIAWALARGEAL